MHLGGRHPLAGGRLHVQVEQHEDYVAGQAGQQLPSRAGAVRDRRVAVRWAAGQPVDSRAEALPAPVVRPQRDRLLGPSKTVARNFKGTCFFKKDRDRKAVESRAKDGALL
eukprot:SAG22_NODE_977_length_6195_cov_6.522060_2_plen_111_part_00